MHIGRSAEMVHEGKQGMPPKMGICAISAKLGILSNLNGAQSILEKSVDLIKFVRKF